MAHELLISEPPLQVIPTLAQRIGLNEAIILQQIHYWLNPKLNKNFFQNRFWVWNTYEQWQEQFPFWGITTIRRVIQNLEEMGILETFTSGEFKKIKHYTIIYDKLNELTTENLDQTEKVAENQLSHSSVHIGQIEMLKSTDRAVQVGQVDLSNMDSVYIDSETTSSENTLPPLTPPSKNFAIEKCHEEEEEEKNQIYFQMLETWNKTIQSKLYCGKEVHLTEKRLERLKIFLYKVLNGKINSWVDYCDIISKSRFLCGQNSSGFKITLDWALVPDNAYKLLEGVIYDKQENTSNQSNAREPDAVSWELFDEELARILPSRKYLQQWLKISLALAKLVGQNKYRTWFSKVSLSDLTVTKATFSVEGSFTKGYIANHFSSEVRQAVQSHFPEVEQIEFHVIPSMKGIA